LIKLNAVFRKFLILNVFQKKKNFIAPKCICKRIILQKIILSQKKLNNQPYKIVEMSSTDFAWREVYWAEFAVPKCLGLCFDLMVFKVGCSLASSSI